MAILFSPELCFCVCLCFCVVQALLIVWGPKNVHKVTLWGLVYLMGTKSKSLLYKQLHFNEKTRVKIWVRLGLG